MDEIFGEENFVEIFSWMKTETPSNLGYKTKKAIEYILCYQKCKDNKKFFALPKKSKSDNPLIKPQNSEKVLEFKKEWLKIGLPDGKCQTLSGKLSWSHYVELLGVSDDLARSFYEKQCIT